MTLTLFVSASSIARSGNGRPDSGIERTINLNVAGFSAVAVMLVVVALNVSQPVASASRQSIAPTPMLRAEIV